MTSQVYEALNHVVKAMDVFNQAVEKWIEEMGKGGTPPDKVKRLSTAAKAMKDSSTIYLAWAEHLANGLPGEDTEPSPPPNEAHDARLG
jgi:hypothetical protein